MLILVMTCSLKARPAEPAAAKRELTLADCVQLALDHNASLRAASEQTLDAQGATLRLRAILYPSVNAQALTAPSTLYVQINQVLYSRATFPQLRIARLGQEQAVTNYRQALTDVVFQVRQSFANTLAARRSADLIRDYITRETGSVSSAQALFEAGKIEKSQLIATQVAQNNFARQQLNTELSVQQDLLALDNLLGTPLPAGARLVGEFEHVVPASLDLPTLTAQALRDRTDLRQLETARLSAEQQVLVDQKNALPVVGFSSNSALVPPAIGALTNYDLERNYDEPEVQRQGGNSQLPLSLYFTWTIFDGGTMTGLGLSDRAQIESQQVAIAALRRSIPREVAGAVAAIRTEQATLQTLDALTPISEVRKSSEADFEAGRIRKLDEANFEFDFLGREQARLLSQLRLALALAALDHALGHGLLTSLR